MIPTIRQSRAATSCTARHCTALRGGYGAMRFSRQVTCIRVECKGCDERDTKHGNHVERVSPRRTEQKVHDIISINIVYMQRLPPNDLGHVPGVLFFWGVGGLVSLDICTALN